MSHVIKHKCELILLSLSDRMRHSLTKAKPQSLFHMKIRCLHSGLFNKG